MIFTATPLPGIWLVDLEPHVDERGGFARTFCEREFAQAGLASVFPQCNLSWSARKGTARGMHFQRATSAEAKLVRCVRGAIWDVVVDLRPGSPTARRQFAAELTAANRRALYIPPLCAHGFQTLEDDSEVFYHMGEAYAPDLAAGVRHDDPAIAVRWPLPVSCLSERDRTWPPLGH